MNKTECLLEVLRDIGGDTKYIHIEDIADAAYKARPHFFGCLKYNYPDQRIVMRTLRQGMDKGLIYQNKNTYILSPKGIDTTSRSSISISEKFTKIRRSKLFIRYSKTSSINSQKDEFLFRDMLNVSTDASQQVAKSELMALVSKATSIHDAEVIQFLQKCTTKFVKVLGAS